MNFPIIIDVGIGMIIIYLSAAVVVSGVQEILATLLQWRSKHLKESILQIMLDRNVNDEELEKAKKIRDLIYQNPLIQSMNHTSMFMSWPSLYQHSYANCNPSYIDNKTFAISIIRELCGKSFGEILSNAPGTYSKLEKEKLIHNLKIEIDENQEISIALKKSLITLIDRVILTSKEGEDMLLGFQTEIENWFDSCMDRASGVYKRNSQSVGFILSFILVIFFNLDSLNIAEQLLNNSTIRDLLANNASVIVTSSKIDPSDPNSQLDAEKLQININSILGESLPIRPIYANSSNFLNCPDPNNCNLSLLAIRSQFNAGKFFLAIVGWSLTTLAVFMGAPFWFQLLSKFVNIRSSGDKP